MNGENGKCVFVTVGTTSFNKLLQTVTMLSMMKILSNLGYTKVVLQTGRGNYIPKKLNDNGLPLIEYFDFKDTISEDIKLADLVISHAGAGSILETLEACRPLIVVINEDLMGNHQTELAGKLEELDHLVCCKCSSLEEVIMRFDPLRIKPIERGDPTRMAPILDQMMGLSSI